MVRLLVAALDSELVAFPPELDGFDRLVTGAGKLPAAVRLARALDAHPYEEIVVVGTAGGLDPALDPGVHEVTTALQHDVTDLAGVVGRHITLPERVGTGDGVVIATGDSFVDDAEAVGVIRGLGAQLVDMETYAYLWVADELDVPIRVFKAISDTAQDGATQTWDETVTACSALLLAHLREVYGV